MFLVLAKKLSQIRLKQEEPEQDSCAPLQQIDRKRQFFELANSLSKIEFLMKHLPRVCLPRPERLALISFQERMQHDLSLVWKG